ncbi:hypothetical protein F511_14647 [Dorcoceras hygrometricum]|uniref:Uncharacterized protein n=1 Tax=Dorcoceras hygrometricum TaxID=472368 RepID=A0A2Z7AT80_9LAMI|nr:hypothetical protein F511_14647 [Dorcoceras hygrometricum]
MNSPSLFEYISVTVKEYLTICNFRKADVIVSVWQTVALSVEYTVAVTDGVYDVTVSDNPTMHISVDSNLRC